MHICCKTNMHKDYGRWRHSMTETSYIALHKKGRRGACGNYRALALISHASKIVLATHHAEKPECRGGNGDQRDREIDSYIHGVGVAQVYLAVRRALHLVFVDFPKAFDSVSHSVLFAKLRHLKAPF